MDETGTTQPPVLNLWQLGRWRTNDHPKTRPSIKSEQENVCELTDLAIPPIAPGI